MGTGENPYGICPVCGKERRTYGRHRNTMKPHNRWDDKEKKMVPCLGENFRAVRIVTGKGR
jgi:hypothetical protein